MQDDATRKLMGIAILRALLFVVSAIGFGMALVPLIA